MGKLWEKLKSHFSLTSDQLKYAEQELRFIFGIERKPIRKEPSRKEV